MAKKKAEPGPLIYCGPGLPRGILNQHTVYRGGFPPHLEEHLENCPAIRRLFVSPAMMPETQQAIEKPGTAQSVWFGQVLEYIKGGAK